MIFTVTFPFESVIYGDSFKDAIKNFVKLNHNLNINKMIITDQKRNMEASINYYKEDGRNKVGINMFPVGYPFPTPIVVNDTYVPSRVTDGIVVNPYLPISPLPISPVGIPFVPTVINIPNI